MTEEERWVDVEDVAAHLGVAKDSIYRWIDDRDLPAHRVGRLFRFKISEVDEWVRQGADNNNARILSPPRSSSRSKANRSKVLTRAVKKEKNG